jgi:hydrogenase nickel incorporation protein HypA/HybF
MHEASIALSILGIAEEHCLRAGYSKVESIAVRIGKASGVLAEALLMAFDVVKAGTASEEASLLIDEVPLGGTCEACGSDFTAEEQYILGCPVCGCASFHLSSGRELDVTEIEVS